MKRLLFIFLLVSSVAHAQLTTNPRVDNQKPKYLGIDFVRVTLFDLEVGIDLSEGFRRGADWVTVSKNTVLCFTNPKTEEEFEIPITSAKRYIHSRDEWEDMIIGKRYRISDFGSAPIVPYVRYYFKFLDAMENYGIIFPDSINTITIKEKAIGGFKWENIHIRPVNFSYRSDNNLGEKPIIDNMIRDSKNSLSGIYESLNNNISGTFAFLENDGVPCLVFYSGNTMANKIGDVVAELNATIHPNIFLGELYDYINQTSKKIRVVFDDKGMMTLAGDDSKEMAFIKMQSPVDNTKNAKSVQSNLKGTGSGFFISGNILVTNYHVVDKATTIKVALSREETQKDYNAEVLAIDKANDLALIAIKDDKFTPLSNIPYAISPKTVDVGTSVFTMGFPMSDVLGNEVKITDGIISSRTGFEGNVSTYQISAPIQPGNSGGALFDKRGYVVGITNAGIPTADNIGYAIKSTYLINLIDAAPIKIEIPKDIDSSKMELTEIIKLYTPFVALIKIY